MAHDHPRAHDPEPGHGHAHGSSAHDGHPERIAPGDAYWETCLAEHVQRYEFAAARIPAGARVLDAGCGVGYGSALLADHGAGRVVGVDVSGEAIAVARQRFARDTVTFLEEDCEILAEAGRQGPFDCVVNFENLEHLAHPERFLDRVAELLAPDGVFIVSTPNRQAMNRMHGAAAHGTTANPFHSREFSCAELAALLARRFEVVVVSYQTLDPPERFLYEPILAVLWKNPFLRAGRWIQRVLRGRRITEDLDELLPPRAYRIVHDDPGADLAITTLVECRRPYRTGG